ncbi:MAG: T9SS type A sorting domain-containing protein, partial [Ignavibacteria bacterium]|nr:T9SS type A sorting domain-containing protein [Ignavibacteria bacterium]
TLYAPGDSNSDTLFCSISVGSNGGIIRGTGRSSIVYQRMESGTIQQLNMVRGSNNPYQNNAAVVGNNGTVLVSTNTGLTWLSKTPITSADLKGVDHSSFLFCVGDNGTILFAIELVTGNLVSQTSGTTRNLKDVVIAPFAPQRVIAVGEKGTILRSSDTGFNWYNVSVTDTSFDFNALNKKSAYSTDFRYIAVGSGGRIYKSTDLGLTWIQKNSGTVNNLKSIYFLNLDSGMVAGDNGTIRLTTDGGETWFSDPFLESPASRNYRSISCIHPQSGTFAAMSDSLFIISNDPINIVLGINTVNAAIPFDFSLSQNYPNPFNPQSKIRFQISKFSDTRLIVYDMLGKEIETLVNQELREGTYEVDFDGSKYSSGVYFYKLITRDFAETRKMILLK